MNSLVDVSLERDELHERLGGGVPRGSLVLVEGPPGSGKSVLAERLLFGALAHGASATLVSTELTTPAFLSQMHSLGYAVAAPLLEGRLAFVPAQPLYARARDAPGRVARLVNARPLFQRDLVIVDTLSALIGRDAADEPARAARLGAEAADALQRHAASGCTILVTVDPAEAPAEVLDAVRARATGYVEAQMTFRSGVARSLVLRRWARAAAGAGDAFGFRVEPGEGFIVEIRSVS